MNLRPDNPFRPQPGRVRLQLPDAAGGNHWCEFRNPVAELCAHRVAELPAALAELARATRRGLHAAGFVAYEAAPAFDPACQVHPPLSGLPLLWFGLYRAAEPLALEPALATAAPLLEWQPETGWPAYEHAIARIRAAIAAGETYQVNHTVRLTAPWPAGADAWALFNRLCLAQRPLRYGAMIELADQWLLSASPELFFDRAADGTVTCRPMKGTCPRGRTTAEDAALAAALRRSPKERAENVMITDMVRNDLGRVARPGTVRVERLFEVERYDTLQQLTSTVTARTAAGVAELFAALFPCASITGAPKIQTLRLIRELEPSPRGIYTGAIGWAGPDGRARFNVAIRTLHVDHAAGLVRYGVGGGVVWDSTAAAEWAECQTKTRVLRRPPPAFSLLETMLWTPARGLVLLPRHLARLADSAAYFQFPCDLAAARASLAAAVAAGAARHPGARLRVRLLLAADGAFRAEAAPFVPERPRRAWNLSLAPEPVDPAERWLWHKTTRREPYERARAACPGGDDVILWNPAGELTETTLANLALKLDGQWWTPPLAAGLLAGTLRAELLARGRLAERRLTCADLPRAEALALFNSLRGWIPAVFHPGGAGGGCPGAVQA